MGIAGIDGNGQSEFIEAITGLRKVEKGCVILGGTEITNFSPKKSREAGLAHIPEDRNTRGLNRTMTIRENLVAVQEDKAPFAKGIMVNDSASYPFAKEMAEKFDIRPRDTEIPTSSLSGRQCPEGSGGQRGFHRRKTSGGIPAYKRCRYRSH